MGIYFSEGEKPITWMGSSLADLCALPVQARQVAGRALRLVQEGSMPPDWKSLPSVGSGVYEIRIHAGREFRVLYIAKHAEAVYVLHVFEKKTRKTTSFDTAIARRRLASIARRS